jgi:hypothetical protein
MRRKANHGKTQNDTKKQFIEGREKPETGITLEKFLKFSSLKSLD